MNSVLRISEAASLAIHTTALLAANPDRLLSTREIASTLDGSEAHLSKVLQRLARVGLVESVRGPKGGFRLGRARDKISLLDVYQAIEGPLGSATCLLPAPICRGERCVLGGLLAAVNKQVRNYLAKTKLSELTRVFERAKGKPCSHTGRSSRSTRRSATAADSASRRVRKAPSRSLTARRAW